MKNAGLLAMPNPGHCLVRLAALMPIFLIFSILLMRDTVKSELMISWKIAA